MKALMSIIMVVLLIASCKESTKKELIGTWKYEGTEYNKYSKDSTTSTSYFQYTDSNNVYNLLGILTRDKMYTKGYNIDWTLYNVNFDSLKLEYNFITKDKLEVIYRDSSKQIFTRTFKDIYPNKLYFDLFNTFCQNSYMSLDTLGDETLWCKFDISETGDKSISAIEKQVKYFIDKHSGSLPKEEKKDEFDRLFHRMYNFYTWEDLTSKIQMQCSFIFKDLKDNYTFNDKDELEVIIWLDVK